MDRNFTEKEWNEIIKDCLDTHTNLLPYYCKENMACRYSIKRHIKTVLQHNIIPEVYWHGNANDFEWLLTMLSDNYPSSQELLSLAKKETKGEIETLADRYYQHINVMFDFADRYAGYVVLKATEYMLCLYPDAKDKIYVYTADHLHNGGNSDINGAFLIITSDQLGDLKVLVDRKIAKI